MGQRNQIEFIKVNEMGTVFFGTKNCFLLPVTKFFEASPKLPSYQKIKNNNVSIIIDIPINNKEVAARCLNQIPPPCY